jgi:hypothetical protein
MMGQPLGALVFVLPVCLLQQQVLLEALQQQM